MYSCSIQESAGVHKVIFSLVRLRLVKLFPLKPGENWKPRVWKRLGICTSVVFLTVSVSWDDADALWDYHSLAAAGRIRPSANRFYADQPWINFSYRPILARHVLVFNLSGFIVSAVTSDPQTTMEIICRMILQQQMHQGLRYCPELIS